MINKVLLVGHLGKQPELRYTPAGKAVCKFSMAVDGGKDKTEWANVETWEKLAENCGKYLDKGSLVAVVGRLKTQSWDGEDGKKRYKTVIAAETVKFLNKKGEGGQNTGQQGQQQGFGSEIEFDEDSIPF